MPDNNIFSQRLQSKRVEKGFSQNTLAKKVGVSRSLYNKYERAGIRPSHETLILLANELEITVDYLIGKLDNQSLLGEKKSSSAITEDDALKILAKAKNLSIDDINYLKETIKILELKNRIGKLS